MNPEFLQYIAASISALLSGGGIISLIVAKKERKAATNMNNANAVDIMQKVYQQFVKDTASEISQLKDEIKMLRAALESYKATCDNCPNKTVKND